MKDIRSFYEALCRLYPERDACPGDTDGLQICPEPDRPVRRVLCALDLCASSVNAAKRVGADLLLTHHPIFYGGVRTLDPDRHPENRSVCDLILSKIAHISLHTRFDAGNGGMNDTLCAILGLKNVSETGLPDEPRKLARVGDLETPCTPEAFAEFVSGSLDTDVLLTDGGRTIRRVLVVTGGGKDYADLFFHSDADAFLSGELSHHVRVDAADLKKTVLEAGHYGTEKIFLQAIAPVVKRIDDTIELFFCPDTPHEIAICAQK